MAMAESTKESLVLQNVRAMAEVAFSRHWNCEELVADSVSVGWQLYRAKPDAPLFSIAKYSIRRVKCDRQFPRSVRSVDGPTDFQSKPDREDVNLSQLLSRPGDDPALIAALQIDFEQWAESLSPRTRVILETLLMGESTNAVAALMKVSPGRISQFRRELMEDWLAMV